MTQRSVPVGVALQPSFIPYEASHMPVGAAPEVRPCTTFSCSGSGCTLPDDVAPNFLVAGRVVGHGNVQVARSLQDFNKHRHLQRLNNYRLVFAPVVAARGK